MRAGILDKSFGLNLLAAVLPFGVFLGITAAIHFGLPRRKTSSGSPDPLLARPREG